MGVESSAERFDPRRCRPSAWPARVELAAQRPARPHAHAARQFHAASLRRHVDRPIAFGHCGPARSTDSLLVRVHSECLTGDLLGSLRCDCGPQLDRALDRLAAEGNGVLLYLRQEGRGIGLTNKLRTYAIQDRGFDTVEANEQIGFSADLRDYNLAAEMLVDLGVSTIRLLTNNPQKVRGLKKHGISVAARVPLVVESCSENVSYLDVKRKKLGHWLS